MTVLVGLILLLIFLCFAALMFLERLSALLALPLMAAAFVLAAAVADLTQPAVVTENVTRETLDAFGRRQINVAPARISSRFEQWKQVRRIQADALHAQATAAVQAATELQAELARDDATLPQRLADTLVRIRTREQNARAAVERALTPLPDFFARPPHTAGQRADFYDRLNALLVTDTLKAIPTLLEKQPADQAHAKIAALVADVRAGGEQTLARHPPAPPTDARGFTVDSALRYLLGYLLFVLRAGSLHLYATIIATVFGGMFAMYVKNLKVAERLVYWTAEFAGERPFVIALAVFVVTGVIFTSVGGLGTVIMLGAIILPVLRSVGLGPIVSAGIFLIAIAMGGTLQPVSRRLWLDFYGLPARQLDSILWTMVGLYAAVGVGWIWWGTRRGLRSSFQAEPAPPPVTDGVPARLMLAPLVPVALVYFARLEELSAFTISIAYMFLCVCRRPGAVRLLARSLIEGAQAVMPPVLLMIGIGLLVVALATPPVQSGLRPLLTAAVPDTRWGYVALFALAAPLALYRGPLNVWGMGLAVSATLLATSSLPAAAILGALLAAGMLQGVCDPTNTANVWIAGFQGVTVNQVLRYTLLPVWVAAIVAVVVFGLRFVG